MDRNLRSSGDMTGVAQYVPIGVGCGECELPLWHPKTLCQKICRSDRICSWQHVGRALGNLVLHGLYGGIGSVSTHGTGVTQAEIGVIQAVHVGEVGALGVVNVNWKRTWPLGHPNHRNTLNHWT